MVTILGGLYRVPEGIAKQLHVHYNTRATQVLEHSGGVDVSVVDAQGRAQALRADHCIISAQYDDAEKIFPGLATYVGDFAQSLNYCRLIDLKLGYSAATNSKAYLAQCATVESADLMMFALVHNKAPDRAPAGHSLFTIYTDAAVWDRFVAMTEDEIIEWGRARIETWYPELKGHFVFGHVAREPRSGYWASPGFYRRTAKLFADLAPSRVQLAGDLFGAGSMESAVVWGEKVADRVLSKMGADIQSAQQLKAA
jgi:protoporphyrinogen oxidase